MKKLLIIRHAKSDWSAAEQRDFDRKLNHRGEKNAPEMAQRLVKKKVIPQLLVSSPAMRAITTAGYFAEAFGYRKKDIQQEKSIYEADTTDLLKVINHLDNQYDFVALFGHNPGLTYLVNELCGAGIYNIPTTGMVLIEFPFDDWKMLSGGTGELKFFDYPKNQ